MRGGKTLVNALAIGMLAFAGLAPRTGLAGPARDHGRAVCRWRNRSMCSAASWRSISAR